MDWLYRIADSALAGTLLVALLPAGLALALAGAVLRYAAARRGRTRLAWRAAAAWRGGWALAAEGALVPLFFGELGKARSQNAAPSIGWLVAVALLGLVGVPLVTRFL